MVVRRIPWHSLGVEVGEALEDLVRQRGRNRVSRRVLHHRVEEVGRAGLEDDIGVSVERAGIVVQSDRDALISVRADILQELYVVLSPPRLVQHEPEEVVPHVPGDVGVIGPFPANDDFRVSALEGYVLGLVEKSGTISDGSMTDSPLA